MNIGIITQWFDSGAGHVSRAYASTFAKEHQVFIFSRDGKQPPPGDRLWNDYPVQWGKAHPSLGGIDPAELDAWIREHRLDAVLFNEQRHWQAVVHCKRLGLLTGAYVDYYTQESVPLFHLYDFLICNTKRHWSVFSSYRNAQYCPWGTSLELFKPTDDRLGLRDFQAKPLTFLATLGWDGKYVRQHPQMDRKGCGFILRQFPKVQGTCRLLIYSQTELSGCPVSWQEAVRADPRIEFISGRRPPWDIYSQGDVLLYPSRLDGIGLSITEALSSGLAVAATNNPPMNEFITDGKTGRLIDVDRLVSRFDGYYWPEALCSETSFLNILAGYLSEPESALKQGKQARVYAEENLNWGKNSNFLNQWMTSLSPLSWKQIDPGLIQAARDYDRLHNPSITQSLSQWGRRVGSFCRQRFGSRFKRGMG